MPTKKNRSFGRHNTTLKFHVDKSLNNELCSPAAKSPTAVAWPSKVPKNNESERRTVPWSSETVD